MAVLGQYNFGVYNGGVYNQGFDPNAFSFAPDFYYPLEITMLTTIDEKDDGSEKRISRMHSPIHLFATGAS